MVKRIFGGFFLLIIFLWLSSPKQELYFLLEKELEKKDIIISNERFVDRWYGLEIYDADIYVKGIKMAKVESLKLHLFFLYNKLSVTNTQVEVDPKSIESVTAIFNVIKPYKVAIKSSGSFGTLEGGVYLMEKKLILRVKERKEMKMFDKFLTKDERGDYYEKYYQQ
ncbi:MAG: hypothetical protein KAG56_06315 [Sulfurovaceae bacterium]|nr:hypothetical protein [Sulfurovaceae bacterium]